MTRISSGMTRFYKRATPVIMSIFFVFVLVGILQKHPKNEAFTLFSLLILTGVCVLVYRSEVAPMADEVWDQGDSLLIKRQGIQEHVFLRDITGLQILGRFQRTPRVKLMFSGSTRFGDSVIFFPEGGQRGFFSYRNSVIEELERRINRARRQGFIDDQKQNSAATTIVSNVASTLADLSALTSTIASTRAHLLSLRNAAGHWEGELSSSALSTATATVALTLVDHREHEKRIIDGVRWLVENQNADGGWGDTTISKTNLSTTLLCWSALSLRKDESGANAVAKAEQWICDHVGSLDPEAIAKAVVARYGKDKTFSVPILMTCAIGGRMGNEREAWRRVLPLPFELAALPREWFGAIGLPVVSYALPALIAIGYARYYHARPAWWNPLGWLRGAVWHRISPMLKTLQPSSGGYLEATPLTSFVTMALASADEKQHPCVTTAVDFLSRSQRTDGAWPIDTNLATWATTLSVKALCSGTDSGIDREAGAPIKSWLLAQQYKVIHPFTNAAPGGWAWTDLPGGVPDADDTSGALIALWHLCDSDEERTQILPAVNAGIVWLLGLQNRDGGMPTFCRGWGALPFDRSTPEITAHALWAWSYWKYSFPDARMESVVQRAIAYLQHSQRAEGSWIPLWFGNEHAPEEENPVHGTAMVLLALSHLHEHETSIPEMIRRGVNYLSRVQRPDGGWGGASEVASTIEETANAVSALAALAQNGCDLPGVREAAQRGAAWLCQATQNGTVFPSSPIGLYFARLWYHEKTYPILWTLAALQNAASLSTPPMAP